MAENLKWLDVLVARFKSGVIARMELVDAVSTEIAAAPLLERTVLSRLEESSDPELRDCAARVATLLRST